MYSAWLYFPMFFILVWNNSGQYFVVKYHTKLYMSSKVKKNFCSQWRIQERWFEFEQIWGCLAMLVTDWLIWQMLAVTTKYGSHSTSWLPADAQLRRSHGTKTVHVCSACWRLFCVTGLLWLSVVCNLARAGYFTTYTLRCKASFGHRFRCCSCTVSRVWPGVCAIVCQGGWGLGCT